jgi:hypothetical protein
MFGNSNSNVVTLDDYREDDKKESKGLRGKQEVSKRHTTDETKAILDQKITQENKADFLQLFKDPSQNSTTRRTIIKKLWQTGRYNVSVKDSEEETKKKLDKYIEDFRPYEKFINSGNKYMIYPKKSKDIPANDVLTYRQILDTIGKKNLPKMLMEIKEIDFDDAVTANKVARKISEITPSKKPTKPTNPTNPTIPTEPPIVSPTIKLDQEIAKMEDSIKILEGKIVLSTNEEQKSQMRGDLDGYKKELLRLQNEKEIDSKLAATATVLSQEDAIEEIIDLRAKLKEETNPTEKKKIMNRVTQIQQTMKKNDEQPPPAQPQQGQPPQGQPRPSPPVPQMGTPSTSPQPVKPRAAQPRAAQPQRPVPQMGTPVEPPVEPPYNPYVLFTTPPTSPRTTTPKQDEEKGRPQDPTAIDTMQPLPSKSDLIPEARLGTKGKDINDLIDDIKYFMDNFEGQLKREKGFFKNVDIRNIKELRELHDRIVGKLAPEKRKSTDGNKVGIIVNADDYIREQMKKILQEQTFSSLRPADVVIDVGSRAVEGRDAKDFGDFEVKRTIDGGLSSQREAVYRYMPNENDRGEEALTMKKKSNRIKMLKPGLNNKRTTAIRMNTRNPFRGNQNTIKLKYLY